MCFIIRLSQDARELLGQVIAAINLVLALFGFCLIFVGVGIRVHLDDKALLFEDYNQGVIPNFLIVEGILMLVVHVLCAKLFHDVAQTETRDRVKNMMRGALVFLFAFVFTVLSAGIICFEHASVIEESVGHGMKAAMLKYRTDPTVKTAIDNLQLKFKCCGSSHYKEWFAISWVNRSFVKVDCYVESRFNDEYQYVNDDAPFSCCDITSPRPCIHHEIGSKNYYKNYDKVTLNMVGCAKELKGYFEDKVLSPVGSAIFIAMVVQVIVIILGRFLQTSVESAEDNGDPNDIGDAYLFKPWGTSDDPAKTYVFDRRKKEKEQAEEDLFDEADGGEAFSSLMDGKDSSPSPEDKKKSKSKKKGDKDERGREKSKSPKKDRKDKSPKKERQSRKDSPKKKDTRKKSKSKSPSPKRSKSPKRQKSPGKKKTKRSKSPKRR